MGANHPAGEPTRLGRRALVIGASIAGLLAARVLSERFEEVWLLDRDELPQGAQARKGTPHAVHTHGLLAGGRMVLEELFPGLTQSLIDVGASTCDLAQGSVFIAGGRRFARAPSGLLGLSVSRLRLEAEIRRRVLALPAVQVRSGVDVQGLVMNDTNETVTGLRLSVRDGQHDGDHEVMLADLVVDASGRASRTPKWLQEHGYDAPEEERVGEGHSVGYVTAYFEHWSPQAPDFNTVIYSVTQSMPRGGALLLQEPDGDGPWRWALTMGGYGQDRPEPSLEGMLAWAHRLDCKEFLDVLQHGKPIGEIMRYQLAYSQRRHYERLTRFPAAYLAIGDALASFNPIYGQGMSSAAGVARALRDALEGGLDAMLYKRYFKRASKVIDIPWQTAVGSDLALDFIGGVQPWPIRLINAYVRSIHVAAQHDAQVSIAFLKMGHLLAPPTSLFAPGMLARVLWGNLRSRWIDPTSVHPVGFRPTSDG